MIDRKRSLRDKIRAGKVTKEVEKVVPEEVSEDEGVKSKKSVKK